MCVCIYGSFGFTQNEMKYHKKKHTGQNYLNENCFSIRLNIKMQLTFNHSTLFLFDCK